MQTPLVTCQMKLDILWVINMAEKTIKAERLAHTVENRTLHSNDPPLSTAKFGNRRNFSVGI